MINSAKHPLFTLVLRQDFVQIKLMLLIFRLPARFVVSGNQHTAFHSHSAIYIYSDYEYVRYCKKYGCIQIPTDTLAGNL